MPHAYTKDQLVEQPPKKRGGQKTWRWRVIEVRKPDVPTIATISILRRPRDLPLPKLLADELHPKCLRDD